jgi:hypothetical protein
MPDPEAGSPDLASTAQACSGVLARRGVRGDWWGLAIVLSNGPRPQTVRCSQVFSAINAISAPTWAHLARITSACDELHAAGVLTVMVAAPATNLACL